MLLSVILWEHWLFRVWQKGFIFSPRPAKMNPTTDFHESQTGTLNTVDTKRCFTQSQKQQQVRGLYKHCRLTYPCVRWSTLGCQSLWCRFLDSWTKGWEQRCRWPCWGRRLAWSPWAAGSPAASPAARAGSPCCWSLAGAAGTCQISARKMTG